MFGGFPDTFLCREALELSAQCQVEVLLDLPKVGTALSLKRSSPLNIPAVCEDGRATHATEVRLKESSSMYLRASTGHVSTVQMYCKKVALLTASTPVSS